MSMPRERKVIDHHGNELVAQYIPGLFVAEVPRHKIPAIDIRQMSAYRSHG